MSTKTYVDKTLFNRSPKSASKKNTTVLTANDLSRLKISTPPTPTAAEDDEEYDQEEEEEEELGSQPQQSPTRSISYSNRSLEAVERRFQEREQKKQEAIEAELKLFAEQEAARKAAERKSSIEQAKQKTFFEDDRVKALHSTLNLVETIQERDSQIAMKVDSMSAAKREEQRWAAELHKMAVKERETEKRKVDQERMKRMEVAMIHNVQLAEVRQRQQDKQDQQSREGRLILEENEKFRKQRAEEEKARRDNIVQLQKQILFDNQQLHANQHALRLREKEEDQKAQAYLEESDRINEERKRQQQERLEAKQRVREQLIDKQQQLLAKTPSTKAPINEKKLDREIMAAHLKKEEQERIQEENRKKKFQEIAQYRSEQEIRKHELELQAMRHERNYVEDLREKAREEAEKKERDAAEAKAKQAEMATFLKRQMNEKSRRASLEKEQERKEAEKLRENMEDHERNFVQYTQDCLKGMRYSSPEKARAVVKVAAKSVSSAVPILSEIPISRPISRTYTPTLANTSISLDLPQSPTSTARSSARTNRTNKSGVSTPKSQRIRGRGRAPGKMNVARQRLQSNNTL